MISKIDNKITSIHFALSGANADSLLLTCKDAVSVTSARSNWRDENLANGGGQFPSAPSLPRSLRLILLSNGELAVKIYDKHDLHAHRSCRLLKRSGNMGVYQKNECRCKSVDDWILNRVHPFTPKSDQFQLSPTASPEI